MYIGHSSLPDKSIDVFNFSTNKSPGGVQPQIKCY